MAKSKAVDIFTLRRDNMIRDEYEAFCKERNCEPSPHTADLFASSKVTGGFDYRGMTERELILMLVGKLPQMYD